MASILFGTVGEIMGDSLTERIEENIFRRSRPPNLTGISGIQYIGEYMYWMDAPTPQSNIVIVYLHSNATNLLQGRDFLLQLRAVAPSATLLAPEYYGYSGHDEHRRPTLNGNHKAVATIVENALPPNPHRQFILIGHTIGAAFAAWMAKRSGITCRALILLSPFVSIRHMAIETKGPQGQVVPDSILNIKDYLRQLPVTIPVFLVHCRHDAVIKLSHSRRLAETLSSRGVWHELIETDYKLEQDRDAWVKHMQDFILRLSL